MRKVLVTGGSGYFGSLLVKKLLEKGYDCSVLDINDSEERPTEVGFIRADIRDEEMVRKACHGIEIIFHNVAQVPLAKDRHAFDSVNRIGTENLLTASLAARVNKLVYTSSSAVYGIPQKNPVTEEMIPRPGEAYGRAKLEGEKACHRYVEKGLDVSIIRPRTIMGHGRLGIFQILFEWIREGINVPVLDGGGNIYQFVHADDLAEATILAGDKPGSSVYNCGTDRYGSMLELLTGLCGHACSGSQVRSLPIGLAVLAMKATSKIGLSPLGDYHALMYGRSMYFDISKSVNQLGWKPRYSNEEMFIESYEWYLQNHEKVKNPNKSASHHRSKVKEGILGLLKKML
jgi:nucleoside-diphosphate-sugar epimerase